MENHQACFLTQSGPVHELEILQAPKYTILYSVLFMSCKHVADILTFFTTLIVSRPQNQPFMGNLTTRLPSPEIKHDLTGQNEIKTSNEEQNEQGKGIVGQGHGDALTVGQ
jgi:hypothetical protein